MPRRLPLPPRRRGRSVLLVEDDALILMDTAEMSEASGVGVVEAGSAEDALIALQTAAIDVLVTDVNLPGMSGPELAAKARALNPAVSIVFATVDARAVAELQGDRTILLSKSYDGAALGIAVRAALGNAEASVAQADTIDEVQRTQ